MVGLDAYLSTVNNNLSLIWSGWQGFGFWFVAAGSLIVAGMAVASCAGSTGS